MSKVFLPGLTEKDYSAAASSGEIILLSVNSSPFHINECITKFAIQLKRAEYNPATDFICMTGNSLLISWLIVAALSLSDTVKVLLFDSKNNSYRSGVLEKPYEYDTGIHESFGSPKEC